MNCQHTPQIDPQPMFSPYELGILLHYYGTVGPYPQHAPIWAETVERLVGLDLLKPDGFDYRLTPRGDVFVRLSLCRAPIPVQEWVVPGRN
jgi:hypothetical protein